MPSRAGLPGLIAGDSHGRAPRASGWREIAELAADALAAAGLVLIEDGKLDGLTAVLHGFLIAAGIPLNQTDAG
jgi:hypothetical protein